MTHPYRLCRRNPLSGFRQLVDLATKLPDYKESISNQAALVQGAERREIYEVSEAVEELIKELPGGEEDSEIVPIPGRPETAELGEVRQKRAAPVQMIDRGLGEKLLHPFQESVPLETLRGVG